MLRHLMHLVRAQHLLVSTPAGGRLQCNIQASDVNRHVSAEITAATLSTLLDRLASGQQRTSQHLCVTRQYNNTRQAQQAESTPPPQQQQEDRSQPASSSSSSSQSALEHFLPQPQQEVSVPSSSSSLQQPLAAAYGARRVTAKHKAAGVQKREGIVHVNSTLNNTIMVLTDREHNVITWTSGGTVGYKNANKATPMAAELAAKELAKKAVTTGFHSVLVKLKGMGKNKLFAVQSLAANGLTVTQLWDVTPIPYNGCRLPRRRRV